MSRYEVLEVNDSRDFCECCGKTGLKRVVFIRDTETNDVKHFGTTCAASPTKGFGVDKEIKAAVARFNSQGTAVSRAAYYEYKRRGGSYIAHPTKAHTWIPADQTVFDAVHAEILASLKEQRYAGA
ncbi:hypothetical protein [Cupriavidus gilardii]|uniref:Uncharacterized protein n=1 Tax=Cupriavidus gilardii TaxID=82541 RepID=A0A849BJ78_9BURK|nr:hypothetical protein [Cupriavidus gilardii]KAB0597763.1 hypothetical protein F7Q96_07530 [Cupriavidus gilardii]NNH14068.1 hypothetical protein [Cupriavidus gilardii]